MMYEIDGINHHMFQGNLYDELIHLKVEVTSGTRWTVEKEDTMSKWLRDYTKTHYVYDFDSL